MKLTPKEVEDLVANVVGRDSLNVLRLIKNKKNVSEFKIAENMKLNVNQIRNVLYRMNEHNLVTFTRKKDKKKGWYIYYWTFDEKQAKNLYVFLKRKRLDELKILIDNGKKEESFYVCKTDFIKFEELYSIILAIFSCFSPPSHAFLSLPKLQSVPSVRWRL